MGRNIYIPEKVVGETLQTLGTKLAQGYGNQAPDDDDLVAITDADNKNILAQMTWGDLKTFLLSEISATPIAHDLTGAFHTAAGLTAGHFLKATGAAAFAFAAHGLGYSDVGAEPANANIQSHIGSSSNPHSVTYTQAGAEPANANIQAHIGATSGNPHSVSLSDLTLEMLLRYAVGTLWVQATVVTGTVTQANTRLSMINGSAFVWLLAVDISAYAGVAGTSTPYMIEVIDGAGKKAWGYLVEEGAGETLGADVVVNGDFDPDSDWTKGVDWTISGGTLNINTVGITFTSTYQTPVDATWAIGALFKTTMDVTAITAGQVAVLMETNQAAINWTGTTGAKSGYVTKNLAGKLYVYKLNAATTASVDNLIVKKVTDGPATYSLRVVSALNGSTRNWAYAESGFNANHTSGISYRIIKVAELGNLIMRDGNLGVGATSFGTGAKGVIALGQAVAPTTYPNDVSFIYGVDGEVTVLDDAGNESPISPHAKEWPDDLEVSEKYPQVHVDTNPFLGLRRYVAFCRMVELVEEMAVKANLLEPGKHLISYQEIKALKWDDCVPEHEEVVEDILTGKPSVVKVKRKMPAWLARCLAKHKPDA